MKTIRILFTGVGRRIELLQAFRQAALCLNIDLKIYGADMNGTAPALAYCDYVRKVVSMRDSKYIQHLLDICEMDKIDLVIPTIDTDLLVLSKNKGKFESIGTYVMVSQPDMIEICRNKNYTSKFFISCGLHTPVTINNWKEYKYSYPAFIKPKDGSSSINAFKVETVKELEMYAAHIEDYVIQPFITGREFTIDIFCDWNGNPVTIVPRERLQVRAGEVLKTRIDLDQVMIEESKKICSAFKPCGPITVQLIRDEQGVDWFIEINPRFGGGAPLSMRAGARSAELILKMLNHQVLLYQECGLFDGAVYSRFDQGVCITEGQMQHSVIKGIIFDLDDTLYSEKEYVKSGYKEVAKYLKDEKAFEKMWEYFENGESPIDAYLDEIGKPQLKNNCLKIYRTHFPNIQLYDGVLKLLTTLKRRDFKIGIITDGRPEGQKNKIAALGLDKIVDDIIITDELGGSQFRKPNDISFRIMQRRWRLPFEEIAYVGDNLSKDFQAPKQLGMKSIYYENKEGLYYENSSTETTIKKINILSDVIKFNVS